MITKAVEKRRAEQEILRVNHQSKAIINHLPDPAFVINSEGTIIAWNRALELVTKVSEDEITGKPLPDNSSKIFGFHRPSLAEYILHPDVQIQEWYDNIQLEGNTITAETWIVQGTEENRRVWIKASPLFDEQNNIVGAIETLRDITSIRKNELDLIQKTRELQESGKQLQNIIDFIPDPTFAIDNYGKVIAWNRAIERMTKRSASSIIGKGEYEYAEPFYLEHRPTLIDLALHENPDLLKKYDFVKNEHHHLVAEVFCNAINDGLGAYLWVVVAPLVDTHGTVIGAIESIRDITARKELELELRKKYEELASSYEEIAAQNEEITTSFDELDKQKELLIKSESRFRSFVEHFPDGALNLRDDKIIYANPKAYRILGYEDQIGLIGTSSFDIVHPQRRDQISDRLLKAAQSNNPFIEEIFIKPDGTEIPVEVAGIHLHIEDSVSIMIIFRDITLEHERKTALRQAQDKLKILASITRHDIKNEVSTVMAILDIVSSGDIPDTEAALLKRAFNPCNNILEQLQTTFEYQTLGIQEPGWFNLRSLIESATRYHHLDPSLCSCSNEDATIYADPLITKVIENLLDNSIRHGKNVQKITFDIKKVQDDLLITYEDDGGGICIEDKTRIFEEGYGKNTGLGLFLIKEVLGMTSISIQECGTFGVGVKFEILVPHGQWRN
jgi:PAS domain S-box-containing protein